jgi:hypothetical protein
LTPKVKGLEPSRFAARGLDLTTTPDLRARPREDGPRRKKNAAAALDLDLVVQAHGLDRRPRVELRRVDDEERLHVDADDVPDQLPRREEHAVGAWAGKERFDVAST